MLLLVLLNRQELDKVFPSQLFSTHGHIKQVKTFDFLAVTNFGWT